MAEVGRGGARGERAGPLFVAVQCARALARLAPRAPALLCEILDTYVVTLRRRTQACGEPLVD